MKNENENPNEMSAKEAYQHATYVIGGRFPEGEKVIATSAEHAYDYARDVIKGRWPEGEAAITGHTHKNDDTSGWAYYYARDVIKGRWPEGEKAIAKDAEYAKKYQEFLEKLFE